ncbi:NAD(P)H-dependent oxidoreductase [Nocardiopsis sp. RSe5-2]|uniref:NAD(P)H-dependent oxidoreductase n=1 Tax=Nocardiopsis endophytica TaxID=3018445 RepID=A0ABT4TZB4_9ACTN|nr:NAD(P)H-dependent oxidoreductase [Nocardiopsis endophytica]MDA2809570.1 NAD(P)H-dependent oxidoreductase [Nocardiopsis endophytica]
MLETVHNAPLALTVVTGSTRAGRFGPTVADWFAMQARRFGDMDVDAVDLADHDLPEAGGDGTGEQAAEAARLGGRLAAADAYVFVTPEYNHSFPAPLKNAIDLYREEWRAKPVGFVSYGGMGGGLRAVEQLRLVFAELHAPTVRDTVSFHMAWERFDEQGEPYDAEGCSMAAKGMLAQLDWWGRTLRAGRAAVPYTC